jgi:modulator of FtsH protease
MQLRRNHATASEVISRGGIRRMNAWSGFFQGEVGAAAGLAGLLFVSMSVNQQRILALGRMADRGAEALLTLLLVLIVSSLMLIPAQSLRLAGTECLFVSLGMLVAITLLQRAYMKGLEAEYRSMSLRVAALGQAAIWLIVAAGAVCAVRDDLAGVYLVAAGILLSFVSAGVHSWVLLVEINR